MPNDILKDLNAAISTLMNGSAPQIVAFAWSILNSIAIFQLVMICIRWELDLMDSHHWTRLHMSDVVLFLMKLSAASIMLTFYSSPLPGFGVSFHQLIPSIGQLLANTVNQAGSQLLVNNINAAVKSLPTPSLFSALETMTYVMVLGVMGIFQVVLIAVTAFGFIAVAVLTLTGPLMIPLLLTKNFNKYFFRWIDMMVVYSSYPFISAAFVFVFGNSLNNFFTNTFAGNYTFAQLLLGFTTMLLLVGTFTFSMFKIPAFASQHFDGAGSVYASMAGAAEKFIAQSFGG